jgi:hypothetical protein
MFLFKLITTVLIINLMFVWFMATHKDPSIKITLAVCEIVYVMSLVAIWG